MPKPKKDPRDKKKVSDLLAIGDAEAFGEILRRVVAKINLQDDPTEIPPE